MGCTNDDEVTLNYSWLKKIVAFILEKGLFQLVGMVLPPRWSLGTQDGCHYHPKDHGEKMNKKPPNISRSSPEEYDIITDWAKFPLENPNPVMRTDPDGVILIANRACNLLLREWHCTVGGKLPERMAHLVTAAFRSRKKRNIDVECRSRLYSFIIVPIAKAGYVNLYGVDDTERKQAEASLFKSHAELEARIDERTSELRNTLAALQTERQRLHDVLNMLPAYIILLTPDHQVAFANRFFEERFGQANGRRCFEYLFRRSEPCAHCESFIPLQTKSRHGWEWFGPDGRHYDIADFPFVDHDGTLMIMEMGIDITERKLAEAELGQHKVRLEELVARRTEQLEAVNARLQGEIDSHKQTEAELLRVNRTLKAASDSSLAMAKAENESEYMTEVCRIIVEDCGHSMVWIGMAEKDGAKQVRPIAHSGFDAGFLDISNITWADGRRGHGPTGTAIRTGEICIRGDLLSDPEFQFLASEAAKRGYASAIALPLSSNGSVFGAITIYSNQKNPFTEAEVKLLSELASDLSFGIASIHLRGALKKSHDELEQRVRERTAELVKINQTLEAEIAEREQMQQQLHSLSTMLAKTEERERRRIATDLHDRIIQNLVYANIKLGELRESQPEAASFNTVGEIYLNIQQTIHDLRTLTFELSPPVLYELGFLPAVRWLVQQFEGKYDITVEFQEYDVPDFINEELRIILFQALRELLTNAVKHARATFLKVSVGRDTDILKVVVEDDGIGFDSRLNTMSRKDNTGFGLFNIRQRLESVRGSMTIRSVRDAGTRIELVAPLNP